MSDDNSFNLVDEPWIMARDATGTVHELSIRQLLHQSSALTEIVGDLPTQAFALTRLLLAILHRATDGPRTEQDWADLWVAEQLPLSQIDGYLDRVHDRFDLLHPSEPFYQVANLHTAKNESFGLERLIADAPTGRPYLTLRLSSSYEEIGFAEAARWLVHCQAFDPSGIKSGAVGDPRVKGGKGYPIGVGWAGAIGGVLPVGANLRETLLLNLVAADYDAELDVDRDLPPWERPQLTECEERSERNPRGPVDLLTWQARRIRLFHDGGQVTGVLVCNGDRLTPQNRHRWERMTAWRRSQNQEKQLKLPHVYMPRLHDPDRSLWRGLESLLPARTGSARNGDPIVAPTVLDWISRLQWNERLPASMQLRVRAIGMEYINQNAMVGDVIDDALTMDAGLMSTKHPELGAQVVGAVAAIDQGVRALADLAGNLAIAGGGERAAAQDSARAYGYASLDQPFRSWLAGLNPTDTSPQDARASLDRSAVGVLTRLSGELIDSAGPSAWVGRQVGKHTFSIATAEQWYRRKLREAFPTVFKRPTELTSQGATTDD